MEVKKVLVIFTQIIFSVVLSLCLYVVIFCFDKNMFEKQDMQEEEYVKTDTFEADVQSQVFDLLYYLQLKNNFETDGVFDVDRFVDIYDYIERDLITGHTTGSFAFKIDDILSWGKSGITYDEYEFIIDSKENIIGLAEDGRFEYDADRKKYKCVEDESTEYYDSVSVELIREKYMTESNYGAISIKSKYDIDTEINERELYFGNEYPASLESVLKKSDYIVITIKAFPEDINLYKEKTTKFKIGNTNISYYVINNGGKEVYTNMPDTDDALGQIKRMGAYIYVDAATSTFDSSFNSIESNLYRYLNGLEFLSSSEYTIYIGIDKNLPVADSLYQSKIQYENLKPWFSICILGTIVCIVGFIATIVYMTLTAGYKDSARQIHLYAFDKIKTEIALILLLAGAISIIVLIKELYRNVYNIIGSDLSLTMILIGGITAILDCLFITGYLSIVRRVRANTIWKNSVLFWFMDTIGQAFDSRMVTIRVFIIYIVSVALIFVLSVMAFAGGIEIAFVLLILVAILVGYILIRDTMQRKEVIDGIKRMGAGELDHKIDTEKLNYNNRVLAETINYIGEGFNAAIADNTKSERLKSDLITNVSHDIKTPLTSIINYVDLLKREDINDEKIRGYIDVLDSKSQRLKQLTEDLVEASKISSGNIEINLSKINFVELINQTAGEFDEKFATKGLTLITNLPEENVYIMADGMRIWRVIENLYNNVAKYAMPNTRVYAGITVIEDMAEFSIKNISQQPLNIEANELTERFIRGDVSRSSEGSGLGLSIAKDLTRLQGGTFEIYLDGDLFKAMVRFKIA